MDKSLQNDELVPVTINLRLPTVERLKEIGVYLSFRHRQEVSIERVIKGAIVDYLDLMSPYSDGEKATIKTVIIDDSKYAIRNRFKEIMQQKGMKAVEIHRQTGISESNLSQVLSNKNISISLDTFLRIWIALDCPPIGDCLYRESIERDVSLHEKS